jgi:hypothetical protein
MRFLITMLLVLLPLCAQDPPPAQKKGGGGGAPRNLKVLTPEEVRSAMPAFVAALGVGQSGGCNYCHVQDRASDENPKKVIARAMIEMVKDVNSKVTTLTGESGKVFVTCYTCHRGKTEPETKPAALP